MDQLVKLVPSYQSKYASSWMRDNRISFFKKYEGRYHVYQHSVRGSVTNRDFLGVVFKESCVWVFVPDKDNLKMNWYFGSTRSDAVSGFLRATNREVTLDA